MGNILQELWPRRHSEIDPDGSRPELANMNETTEVKTGGMKMVRAYEVVNNPSMISNFAGKYKIVWDSSLATAKFDHLNVAICLMAQEGWKCINITTAQSVRGVDTIYMYALLEK